MNVKIEISNFFYYLIILSDIWHLDDSYSCLAGHGSSFDNAGHGHGYSIWAARQTLARSKNSIFNCFFVCQNRIKHYLARRKIKRGIHLYEQHFQNAAVRTWLSALKATSKREDRFQLLGYLYQAHMDWGKYREALEYGHGQLGISEELDSPNMRSESYLNLARAHERLGGLER